MLDAAQDFAHELTPPRPLAARHRGVAILTGRRPFLHLRPRLLEDRTDLLGLDRTAETAELAGVDFGRARVAVE